MARDDNRKEIVIAMRGTFVGSSCHVSIPHPGHSSSFQNFLTDVDVFLTTYQSPGVSAPDGTEVHSGFLEAYVPLSLTL